MKIYKHIILLLASVSIIGCSDLVEEPVGLLAPEGFFQTTKDIQAAVNATYAHNLNEEIWGRKLSIALMLRSDMVALTPASSSNARRQQMDNVTALDDSEMIYDPWNRIYQGIAAANGAISGAELVDATDEEKNPIIAQAYFMRAYYYFHAVRLWGAVPYITEPVTATTADEVASISRTPAADVYAAIISDLTFAKTHLPNTQSSRSIPAKSAASSYLALVHLTMGNHQLAFDEAEEVINNAGTYELELEADFQNLFDATKIDASKEPIFAIDYNNVKADDNAYDQVAPMTGIRGNYRFGTGNDGWSQAIPALKVYTDWDENDYRRAVSFDDKAIFFGDHDGDGNKFLADGTTPNPLYEEDASKRTPETVQEFDYTHFGTAAGSTHSAAVARPYIAKYYRFPGEFAHSAVRASSHNISMMRYAEVILIAAEAAAVLNDNASATTYINMIRARARQGGSWENTAPSAVPADISGVVTLNDVLEERRLELAFEAKRWYDIARTRIGTTVYNASGLEGEKSGFSENDYLLPIPGTELISNPNLLPQNPGY